MPIGSTCRACGATLTGDVGWCSTCFAPITPYARREPLHGPGGYVGMPTPTPRTSRWRPGPTTFGPVGRILITIVLLVFLPWGGLGGLTPDSALHFWFLLGWVAMATIVLRQVWKRERVSDDAPPSAMERFRARHAVLGRPIRLGTRGRVLVGVLAVGVGVGAWTGLDDVDRYLWASLALVAGLGIFVATWNEL